MTWLLGEAKQLWVSGFESWLWDQQRGELGDLGCSACSELVPVQGGPCTKASGRP